MCETLPCNTAATGDVGCHCVGWSHKGPASCFAAGWTSHVSGRVNDGTVHALPVALCKCVPACDTVTGGTLL
jgi:hypothetical protein